MSDAQMREQFRIAREIHRQGNGARETLAPMDEAMAERGGSLGRRIATGAIVLVFLNVLFGLGVIAMKYKRQAPVADPLRQQVEDSLGAAAKNAMPAPSLSDDEITLAAPKSEWEKLARAAVDAANVCGGSAVPNVMEESANVVATIPRPRVAEFRKMVLGPNAPASTVATSGGETVTIQIRIAEPTR